MRIVDQYKLAKFDFTPEANARLQTVEARNTLTNDTWWMQNFGQLFGMNQTVPVNNYNALGIAAYRRGIELRAQGIAMMPLKKYNDTGTGREKVPFDLLIQPNSFQSFYDWELWMNAMAVGRGNGLSYILRDNSFKPVALIPIPNPDSCFPYFEGNELWYKCTYAGFPKRIPGIDMVHYKGLTWDNPLWGISPIKYHNMRLGIMIAAENTELNTSKSGGKKFAISATNNIPIETQLLLKQSLENVMNDEAISVALPAGGKIEELTLSPVDLDSINHYNMSVQDVNRILGIPNSLNNLDGATKGSAEQEWQSFYSMTLMADATRNEGELRRKLLTEREKKSYYFKYSFNSLMRANAGDRMEYFGKAIRAGVMQPQTAQDFEELPRTEGSDQSYIDANLFLVSKFEELMDAKIVNLTKTQQPNPDGNNQDTGAQI